MGSLRSNGESAIFVPKYKKKALVSALCAGDARRSDYSTPCSCSKNEKPRVDPGEKEKGAEQIRDGPASQGPQEFQQLVRLQNSIVFVSQNQPARRE